jgi:putative membrane protein
MMITDLYLWVKAIHIISLVAWFAGLFYIFRLFVYHVQNRDVDSIEKIFQTMESKLLRIITLPASIATLATGTLLVYLNPIWLKQGWFHIKLLFVVFLLTYQGLAFLTHRKFSERNFIFSERQCRMINEVPTLILFVVVVMVVLKPFTAG